jgi:hypothetical protein
MRSYFVALLVFAFVSTLVAGDILVDSPGQDNFSTNFKCLYRKSDGTAEITFVGGTYAQQDGRHPKGLSFYGVLGGTRSGRINTAFEYTYSMTLTGSTWVYLYDFTTGQNVDYIQLEVVAHAYSGDCDLMATNPPSGWQTSFPPA